MSDNGLRPEMTQHEILAYLARTLPVRSYLEVGVRDGCTLWVVQEASIQTLRLVALADDWGKAHGGTGRGSHDHIDRLLSAVCYYHNGGEVMWLDGRSQETLPALAEERPDLRFDLVHIDGSHDYEDAYEDFVHGWALCAGVLVAHDAGHKPVRRAMERFAEEEGVEWRDFVGGHKTSIVGRGL